MFSNIEINHFIKETMNYHSFIFINMCLLVCKQVLIVLNLYNKSLYLKNIASVKLI